MAIDTTKIKNAITALKGRIDTCFTKCDEKGSTYSQTAKTTSELIKKIEGITGGSGGSGESGGIPEGYIKPEGTLDITENGSHDVTNYKTANVEVKGEPYELQGKDFESALTDGTLKSGDVVFYLDENSYYKVIGTTTLSYEKISGEEVNIWDGSYYEMGEEIIVPPTTEVTNGEAIEVTTESEMNALLVAENIGKVYKYTGTTTNTYINGDLYVVEEV